MNKLYAQFDFKQHNSSMYNDPANGLAEALTRHYAIFLKKVMNQR
jgi:hypothetical protein